MAHRSLVFALAPLLVATLLSAASPAVAGGDVNLAAGRKTMDLDAGRRLGDLDHQREFGVISTTDVGLPVDLAVDFFLTRGRLSLYDNDYDFVSVDEWKVRTAELNLGARKHWGEQLRPYVGAGLAVVRLDAKVVHSETFNAGDGSYRETLIDDGDTSLGWFVDGGASWLLEQHYNIGLDLRYSDATNRFHPKDEHLGEIKTKGGGFHVTVFVGYHW